MTPDATQPAIRRHALMTREEARRACEEVKQHMDGARRALLDLYEREGWRSLGYSSWRECATEEFELSQRHVYRLLEAAQVERDVCPIGQTPIRESVLRELARAEPEKRQEIFDRAVSEAEGSQPRAARVAELVREAQEYMTPEQLQTIVQLEEAQLLREQEVRDRKNQLAERAAELDRMRERIGQALKIAMRENVGDVAEALRRARDLAEMAR